MKRLDQIVVDQNCASSRTQAQKMIAAGQVSVVQNGICHVTQKPSSKFPENIQLQIRLGAEQRFASRAGLKLQGALDEFSISVEGSIALDVGQSTGGFTDCLLQNGAKHVVGIDVGHDQLAERLRQDTRVSCIEGVNARNLSVETFNQYALPEKYSLIVVDVSFISQTLIIPRLAEIANPGARVISLVKPQFEVGPEGIGKGGLVKSEALYVRVEEDIRDCLSVNNFELNGYSESAITGGDGNREFIAFACFLGNS